MDLSSIRKKIDEIDEQILLLLHKRVELVKKVKEFKKNQKTIYRPGREKKILEKVLKYNKGIFPEKSLLNIYNEILSASRKLQMPLKIGFLGPYATFSHAAAKKKFGSESIFIPLNSIRDVFTELENEQIDYGVVPIENSNEGVVGYTLDMLIEFNHIILSEVYIEISHSLVSKENDIKKIKTLFCHPQSKAQCKTFIENNLKKVQIIEVSSTAEAAKRASKRKQTGALCSKIAAQVYGLNILAENIDDNPSNYTRFLVIGKIPVEFEKDIPYKTSIVCGVKDKPGALFSLLKPFKDCNINLTKIESRPTKRKAWEYIFFIDFEGKLDDVNVKKAMKKIQEITTYYKYLGSYPAEKRP